MVHLGNKVQKYTSSKETGKILILKAMETDENYRECVSSLSKNHSKYHYIEIVIDINNVNRVRKNKLICLVCLSLDFTHHQPKLTPPQARRQTSAESLTAVVSQEREQCV